MASEKIVLITGANQGVGYETAKNLAETSHGYHIILGSRSLERGDAAVAELKSSDALKSTVSTVELDITSDASVSAAAEHVQSAFGRIDCLVNNAGINKVDAAKRVAITQDIFDTNVTGQVRATEAFLPLLRKSEEPRLYFVSSSMGSLAHAANPESQYYKGDTIEYRASKAAVNMFMLQYARLLKPEGFKVCCLDPGLVVTNLMSKERARARGAPEADVSGKFFADVVRGDKDDDMTQVLGRYGVQLW